MSFSVIVLAAGYGSRMCSKDPKTLHSFMDKPVLSWIINVIKLLLPFRIVVVYGYKGYKLKYSYKFDSSVIWVHQHELTGTGGAVIAGLHYVGNVKNIFILCGDVPLIKANTLKNMLYYGEYYKCVILTAIFKYPYGFGRILRDENNNIFKIVEESNATFKEKKIKEINSGIYLISRKHLLNLVSNLNLFNNNELQFTDIIYTISVKIKTKLLSVFYNEDIFGPNTRKELVLLERYFQYKQAMFFLDRGVTIKDPNRLDIKGNVIIAKDVSIGINVIIEGNVEIRSGVVIESNVFIKCSKIYENVIVGRNSFIENSIIESNSIVKADSKIYCII